MHRWDIINYLIKQNNYKSYLEIGYYKGWSFDRVDCEIKIAVDPNPCKTLEQEKWAKDLAHSMEDSHYIVKTTSDFFFANTTISKYDIIFIDGLHQSEQVDRDIKNALEHLNPNGVIVMHDCNPSTEEMSTTGVPSTGEWCGDVYKSAIKLNNDPMMHFYTVNTDYGVGILRPNRGMHINGRVGIQRYLDNWDEFDSNREDLLNLISPKEFLEREKKTNE